LSMSGTSLRSARSTMTWRDTWWHTLASADNASRWAYALGFGQGTCRGCAPPLPGACLQWRGSSGVTLAHVRREQRQTRGRARRTKRVLRLERRLCAWAGHGGPSTAATLHRRAAAVA
jgi:hypothetical protein